MLLLFGPQWGVKERGRLTFFGSRGGVDEGLDDGGFLLLFFRSSCASSLFFAARIRCLSSSFLRSSFFDVLGSFAVGGALLVADWVERPSMSLDPHALAGDELRRCDFGGGGERFLL